MSRPVGPDTARIMLEDLQTETEPGKPLGSSFGLIV
jgi:hypothetical protein